MADMKISEMMQMQLDLWEKHKDKWSPMDPEFGRNSILWLVEELGEAIAIIKKKGENQIMSNKDVRSHFVEELSDVLMYYTDTLLRFGITAEEITNAYIEKHNTNKERNYSKEYKEKSRK